MCSIKYFRHPVVFVVSRHRGERDVPAPSCLSAVVGVPTCCSAQDLPGTRFSPSPHWPRHAEKGGVSSLISLMASANGDAGDPDIDAALCSRIAVAEDVVASLARRVIALEDACAAGNRGVEEPDAAPAADGKVADVVAAAASVDVGGSSAAAAPDVPITSGDAAAASGASVVALLPEILQQLSDLRADMVSVGQAHDAEVTALSAENAKLRYRIKHLLRALDASDE